MFSIISMPLYIPGEIPQTFESRETNDYDLSKILPTEEHFQTDIPTTLCIKVCSLSNFKRDIG